MLRIIYRMGGSGEVLAPTANSSRFRHEKIQANVRITLQVLLS